jgi:hypothetical protein
MSVYLISDFTVSVALPGHPFDLKNAFADNRRLSPIQRLMTGVTPGNAGENRTEHTLLHPVVDEFGTGYVKNAPTRNPTLR